MAQLRPMAVRQQQRQHMTLCLICSSCGECPAEILWIIHFGQGCLPCHSFTAAVGGQWMATPTVYVRHDKQQSWVSTDIDSS
jgi:hypothetical protein